MGIAISITKPTLSESPLYPTDILSLSNVSFSAPIVSAMEFTSSSVILGTIVIDEEKHICTDCKILKNGEWKKVIYIYNT
jgi:hypothetical protein